MINKLAKINLISRRSPAVTATSLGPVFPLGFADEVGALRGRLPAGKGAILIPNGREWLAREIRPFVNELVLILFDRPELQPLGHWRDDLELGLQEGLSNSFAHAVREKGRVWVRWQVDSKQAVFAVVDEGQRSFNLNTPSALKLILDAFILERRRTRSAWNRCFPPAASYWGTS
jgi:hypothetical protein